VVQWSSYSPDAILALFDKTGVRKAIVSSTPDDGTLRLYEKAPDRIVPVLRPYRTRADMGTWTTDTSGIEEFLRRYPQVRWLWAHAGLGEPFEAVARVVDRNPALMSELSLKSEVATNGKLDPRWKDLFLRYPDRVMLVTDT
jgi:predicted TIM-barrel fold metal-dependent hydrolase